VQLGFFKGIYVPSCPGGIPQDIEEKERPRSRWAAALERPASAAWTGPAAGPAAGRLVGLLAVRRCATSELVLRRLLPTSLRRGVPGYTGVQPPPPKAASAVCQQQQRAQQQGPASPGGFRQQAASPWGAAPAAPAALAEQGEWAYRQQRQQPEQQQQQQGQLSPRYFDQGVERIGQQGSPSAQAVWAAPAWPAAASPAPGQPTGSPAAPPATDREFRPTSYAAAFSPAKPAWKPGQPVPAARPYSAASAASIAAYGGIANSRSRVFG
jgi:hypothetical protein